MLILSRKENEAVMVGTAGGFRHLLKVTILEIKNGRVRLGFDVDATVPVHRWEVWERIKGNGCGQTKEMKADPPTNPNDDSACSPPSCRGAS